MNSELHLLQPYPFEKLRALLDGASPPASKQPIRLTIGEPRHGTPAVIAEALVAHVDGLSVYPTATGTDALREAMATWLRRRYRLRHLDMRQHVLPVNGTREALFAIAQATIDRHRSPAHVLLPNPFYQIYEGAALLAGARPLYLDHRADRQFAPDWRSVPDSTWTNIQLVYVCSPSNPTGRVTTLEEWRELFELADRFDFMIAADECYSEIYFDEAHPPLGALQAAEQLGRNDYRSLLAFSSLSKRSGVPGLRSGFVAGDALLLQDFLRYRTYHGCSLGLPLQAASAAAWNDEAHVIEGRCLYREKFAAFLPRVTPWLRINPPEAGFYLWARTPIADTDFARRLHATQNVTVLLGRFIARDSPAGNPGNGFVRIALVDNIDACVEAADRIALFCQQLAEERR